VRRFLNWFNLFFWRQNVQYKSEKKEFIFLLIFGHPPTYVYPVLTPFFPLTHTLRLLLLGINLWSVITCSLLYLYSVACIDCDTHYILINFNLAMCDTLKHTKRLKSCHFHLPLAPKNVVRVKSFPDQKYYQKALKRKHSSKIYFLELFTRDDCGCS